MELYTVAILGFFGLCFGSFIGAQVWRLRAHQLDGDKRAGEDYDKKEYTRLNKLIIHRGVEDRSHCLSCGHQLAWYDLIPLASWLSTGGRCRYCKKPIGIFEPLVELGTTLFFIVSYVAWPFVLTSPLEIGYFGFWLLVGLILITLFAYDMKWYLLPDVLVFPAMILAAIAAEIRLAQGGDVVHGLVSLDGAVFILSGVYLIIYFAGERLGRQWIGFGDVKLGLILALMLADWQLALLALFLANLIGCIIVLPLMITGKISRTMRIPFGPLLIIGFFIAGIFGHAIIDWYLGVTVGVM